MINLFQHQQQALDETKNQNQNHPCKGNYKHGLRHHRLYRIWSQMKNRCYNKNDPHFSRWGVRGITVCDEWLHDFKTFYEWAMANGYSDNLTLDRRDNDGNYEPSNCKWSTVKEQNRNKRNVKFIEYKGESRLLEEWAVILNIKPKTLWMRLYYYNWPIEKAFTTKVR